MFAATKPFEFFQDYLEKGYLQDKLELAKHQWTDEHWETVLLSGPPRISYRDLRWNASELVVRFTFPVKSALKIACLTMPQWSSRVDAEHRSKLVFLLLMHTNDMAVVHQVRQEASILAHPQHVRAVVLKWRKAPHLDGDQDSDILDYEQDSHRSQAARAAVNGAAAASGGKSRTKRRFTEEVQEEETPMEIDEEAASPARESENDADEKWTPGDEASDDSPPRIPIRRSNRQGLAASAK